MLTLHASNRGWKLLHILNVVIALMLAACFSNVPSQLTQVTLPATKAVNASAVTRNSGTAIPASTSTLAPTVRPQATDVLTKSIVSPTSTVVGALQIESGRSEQLRARRCVLKAVWSDDERLLYYAYSQDCRQTPITWAAFDITHRITRTVAPPPNYDGHIWSGLNLGFAPELRGYASPSGKYVLYLADQSASTGTPAKESKFDFWIADSNGNLKTKLFRPGLSTICSAAWLKGETKVIFDVCYEGEARDLRIADVQTGKVVSLQDVTDFKAMALDYALSPDGTTLAVTDFDGTLWLVSLEDGQSRSIDQVVTDPSWPKDGSTLYYRWGTALANASTIRFYDVRTSQISTVVDEESLARADKGLLHGDFAVSPSGDKIALWNDSLWLLQLNK